MTAPAAPFPADLTPATAAMLALCRDEDDPLRTSAALGALTDRRLRWGDALELAVNNKLTGLLAAFTDQHLTSLPGLTSTMARHLAGTLRATRHKNALYRSVAATLCGHLAGLRFAAWRGIDLEGRLYGGDGRRPLSDIDLLVHPGDLAALTAALHSLSYRSDDDDPTHLTAATNDLVLPTIHLDLAATLPPTAPPPTALLERAVRTPIPGHSEQMPVLEISDVYRLLLLDLARPISATQSLRLLTLADAARAHRAHAGPLVAANWNSHALTAGRTALAQALPEEPDGDHTTGVLR